MEHIKLIAKNIEKKEREIKSQLIVEIYYEN